MNAEEMSASQLTEIAAGLSTGPAVAGFFAFVAGVAVFCAIFAGALLALRIPKRVMPDVPALERVRAMALAHPVAVLGVALPSAALAVAVTFAQVGSAVVPETDLGHREACRLASERAIADGASTEVYESLLGTCGSRTVIAAALAERGGDLDPSDTALLEALR